MGDVAIIKRQRGSGKGSAPSIKHTTTTITEVKGAKQSGNVGGRKKRRQQEEQSQVVVAAVADVVVSTNWSSLVTMVAAAAAT